MNQLSLSHVMPNKALVSDWVGTAMTNAQVSVIRINRLLDHTDFPTKSKLEAILESLDFAVGDIQALLKEINKDQESMSDARYIVRGTDHAQDEPDTISRPEVFDTKTNKSVGGRWRLNDWDRAERFAAEMMKREDIDE